MLLCEIWQVFVAVHGFCFPLVPVVIAANQYELDTANMTEYLTILYKPLCCRSTQI